jgi:uncharacterized membrane protein YsdA (DUF1294 family)
MTYFIYGFDKSAAQNQRWRVAERTLHLLALLGGWPGAYARSKDIGISRKNRRF